MRTLATLCVLFVVTPALVQGSRDVETPRQVRAVLEASANAQNQPGEVSLEDTLDWLKGRLDDRTIDNVGVARRSRFSHRQCNVIFTAQYDPVPLSTQADFSLSNIGSVELEENSDQRRVTTSIVFRSPAGRPVIHTAKQQGPFLSLPPSNESDNVNIFRWPIGYSCVGCANSHKDIGGRMVKAFVHAVKLCGGGEPF